MLNICFSSPLSAVSLPGQQGSEPRHDSFESLPSSDHGCLKSCLPSPPDGLPTPGLGPGSAPYWAAFMYHSHSMSLSFLICKIDTFIDSTNSLLSVLGSGDQVTKMNETACLQGPHSLVGETNVKSETHGRSSKNTAGSDQLSSGGLGKPSEEGTSESHLER